MQEDCAAFPRIPWNIFNTYLHLVLDFQQPLLVCAAHDEIRTHAPWNGCKAWGCSCGIPGFIGSMECPNPMQVTVT